ncbi:CD209 antigen-like [Lytechinus pictus]|uniref:CD209 antigen-like n=1 Tax=Lytechinus pictus TaxID=7653 RepID=UPI0030BA2136
MPKTTRQQQRILLLHSLRLPLTLNQLPPKTTRQQQLILLLHSLPLPPTLNQLPPRTTRQQLLLHSLPMLLTLNQLPPKTTRQQQLILLLHSLPLSPTLEDMTTTTTATLSPTAADAAPGWKCTSSKCYRLYDEQERVWADAKAFCSEIDPVNTPYGYRSPSLLFLNTEKEANDLLDLQLGLTDGLRVWINCNDQSTEGEFVCDVDGNGTPSSSSWWDQGEPNEWSGQDEDCVAVVKRKWSELLKWRNIPCSWTIYTMCQYIVGQPEQ